MECIEENADYDSYLISVSETSFNKRINFHIQSLKRNLLVLKYYTTSSLKAHILNLAKKYTVDEEDHFVLFCTLFPHFFWCSFANECF